MYIVIEIFDRNDCEKYDSLFYKIENKYMEEESDVLKYTEQLRKHVRNKFPQIEDNYYDEYIELEIHYMHDEGFTTINIDD